MGDLAPNKSSKGISRLTRHGKRIRIVFIATTLGMLMLTIMFFPWFGKSVFYKDDSFYLVMLSGNKIGYIEDKKQAEEAYLEARLMLEQKDKDTTYIDYELKIYRQDSVFADISTKKQLKEKIYEALKERLIETKVRGYTVDIDGYMITLGSKDDVVKLLNASKDRYDEKGEFDAKLTLDNSKRGTSISYDMLDKEEEKISLSAAAAVRDVINAETSVNPFLEEDHILSISYEEDIYITSSYVSASEILPVDTAIEYVTKEREENQVYEVKEGDTLYGIANEFNLSLDELLAMNPDYNENGYINIGDSIIVTVPEPELSVVVKKQEKSEEDYNLPVEYIKNDSQYNTWSNVLNEGSPGHRNIVAEVTYKNGNVTDRKVIAENVTKEPVARVVEVGTITPPTYIKPISGGYVSSTFGYRWGRLHGGIDYAVSTGTTVRASSGGTVVQAGWNGGYGYSILIKHPDGKQTRYGHLSRILVSSGETVSQGDKIALSGNTGDSTGPHLHFEIISGGQRVDPAQYINK